MITYAISAAAEKFIAVTMDRAGSITCVCHQRAKDGVFQPRCEQRWIHSEGDSVLAFTARVQPGHSGIVEILPGGSTHRACAMIPLGADRPFLESELPPRAGADGAFSQSETIALRFGGDALSWSIEGMGGRMELTDQRPSISVVLRLSAGNDGEIVFVTPHVLCIGTAQPDCAPDQAHCPIPQASQPIPARIFS